MFSAEMQVTIRLKFRSGQSGPLADPIAGVTAFSELVIRPIHHFRSGERTPKPLKGSFQIIHVALGPPRFKVRALRSAKVDCVTACVQVRILTLAVVPTILHLFAKQVTGALLPPPDA